MSDQGRTSQKFVSAIGRKCDAPIQPGVNPEIWVSSSNVRIVCSTDTSLQILEAPKNAFEQQNATGGRLMVRVVLEVKDAQAATIAQLKENELTGFALQEGVSLTSGLRLQAMTMQVSSLSGYESEEASTGRPAPAHD